MKKITIILTILATILVSNNAMAKNNKLDFFTVGFTIRMIEDGEKSDNMNQMELMYYEGQYFLDNIYVHGCQNMFAAGRHQDILFLKREGWSTVEGNLTVRVIGDKLTLTVHDGMATLIHNLTLYTNEYGRVYVGDYSGSMSKYSTILKKNISATFEALTYEESVIEYKCNKIEYKSIGRPSFN